MKDIPLINDIGIKICTNRTYSMLRSRILIESKRKGRNALQVLSDLKCNIYADEAVLQQGKIKISYPG